MTTVARLDELAEELTRQVRHAAGARADAEVAATLDGMTAELNGAATQIEQLMKIVAGPSPLVFPTTLADTIAERRQWVEGQAKKVRAVVEEDPMKVRQGKLWAETQRATATLRKDLEAAIDEAFEQMLEPFRGDDLDILETLPPGTTGVGQYREAIDEFERVAGVRPTSPEEATNAAAVGRRLLRLRGEIEAETVPAEFADQWRLVRTTGLPLTQMTDEFSGWLRERGFASSTVVSFRGR